MEDYTTPSWKIQADIEAEDAWERRAVRLLQAKLAAPFVGGAPVCEADRRYYDWAGRELDGRGIRLEVKHDYEHANTNNLAFEFECRGKKSSILVTTASHYVEIVEMPGGTQQFYVVPVPTLLWMLYQPCGYMRHGVTKRWGGDKRDGLGVVRMLVAPLAYMESRADFVRFDSLSNGCLQLPSWNDHGDVKADLTNLRGNYNVQI